MIIIIKNQTNSIYLTKGVGMDIIKRLNCACLRPNFTDCYIITDINFYKGTFLTDYS